MKGCTGRNCPCEMWANCNYYLNIGQRKWRRQHMTDKFLDQIHQWYKTNFRIDKQMVDTIPNG